MFNKLNPHNFIHIATLAGAGEKCCRQRDSLVHFTITVMYSSFGFSLPKVVFFLFHFVRSQCPS